MLLDLGGGRLFVSGVVNLSSIVGAIGGEQASERSWDCSGLDHVVWRCFLLGTKWYSDGQGHRLPGLPGVSKGWQQFCWFFKLLPWHGGLASDCDFYIFITRDHTKSLFSYSTFYCMHYFAILDESWCCPWATISHKG